MSAPGPDAPALDLRTGRRRLLLDMAGIAVSAIGFGFVFGLAAREAGYSVIEAVAMSTILFAGAAQFAAVGYVAAGLPWPPIIVLTLFLNARHLPLCCCASSLRLLNLSGHFRVQRYGFRSFNIFHW